MDSKTIAIFSNKGGVGKTFCAVNLAATLALSDHRVLLLDFDIQAGHDMARMLNLEPERSLAQLLTEIRKIENPGMDLINKFVISHSSGLDFLPAIMKSQEISSLTSRDVKPFLKIITQNYDYTILDLGQTFSEITLTALDLSNLILLIATPDILAVYQLRWCLQILQNMHFPLQMIKVILNRAESQGGVAWQEVRNALKIDIIGRIPSDGQGVGMSLAKGVPIVIDNPRGTVTGAFKKMIIDLKKDDLYLQTTEFEKRHIDANKFEGTSGVWEQHDPEEDSEQHQEMIDLKIKIQKKLIERLDLKSLTADDITDPEKILDLRESAKKTVSALLLEEKGAMISSHEERLRLSNEIVAETFGLGVLEEILSDPDVSDIMINGSQEIYVEKKGKLFLTKYKFLSDQQLRAIVDRIVAPLGRRIDESMPLVDARLADGSRFNAIIPPLCLSGPSVTIRKFGHEKLTVDDILYKFHSFSEPIRDFLYACVLGRMNIIISGGTGSGKTTFLNVLSEFVPDEERIITIEEAAELRLRKDHWCRLESRPSNVEGKGEVTLRDLFVNSLRMRPDRIVIGECRGAEVLDMLQAMNTGHDGSMTTLHANSTRDVLIRMSSMILLSGIELPIRAINEMISSAINVIVHMARFTDGSRKVTGITEIVGISEEHELILRDIFHFRQTGRDSSGNVTGFYETDKYIPKCADILTNKGIKIDKSIFNSEPVPS